MYHYVDNSNFFKKAKPFCSCLFKELEQRLIPYGIISQSFIVGSRKRNMVTQNEDKPIDFDYNLNIIRCQDWNDTQSIKETVRIELNKLMKTRKLEDVSDSTSVLTSKMMYLEEFPEIQFSFDLAIVTKDEKGNWLRLVHEKTGFMSNDRWFWNQAPQSSNIKEKEKIIKNDYLWKEVREVYLEKKNLYLKRNDYSHPSYICYIESINEIFYKYYNDKEE